MYTYITLGQWILYYVLPQGRFKVSFNAAVDNSRLKTLLVAKLDSYVFTESKKGIFRRQDFLL